jgi:hypothetical protein
MGWGDLPNELWDQSAQLNAERDDHPLCDAISRLGARGETSCQYALYLLPEPGQPPEDSSRSAGRGDVRLPDPGAKGPMGSGPAPCRARRRSGGGRADLGGTGRPDRLRPQADNYAGAHGRSGPHDARDPVAAQMAAAFIHPQAWRRAELLSRWRVQAMRRRRRLCCARAARSRLRSAHRPEAGSSRSCAARCSASGPTLAHRYSATYLIVQICPVAPVGLEETAPPAHGMSTGSVRLRSPGLARLRTVSGDEVHDLRRVVASRPEPAAIRCHSSHA